MTRSALAAVGRWLVRATGLRVVRVRVVVEERGSRYAEGFADGLARVGIAPDVVEVGGALTRHLRLVDNDPA